jgi:hypothetical protein
MITVYRFINVTKQEVYHGVSIDPQKRRSKSHCLGGTKALRHWDCENDKIVLRKVSNHRKQTKASEKAHQLEKEYCHRKGFCNIKTKGI